jgi:hypothetical protein
MSTLNCARAPGINLDRFDRLPARQRLAAARRMWRISGAAPVTTSHHPYGGTLSNCYRTHNAVADAARAIAGRLHPYAHLFLSSRKGAPLKSSLRAQFEHDAAPYTRADHPEDLPPANARKRRAAVLKLRDRLAWRRSANGCAPLFPGPRSGLATLSMCETAIRISLAFDAAIAEWRAA